MSARPLRFATFLAPSIFPVYEFIVEYIGSKIGLGTELIVGTSLDEFAEGTADAGFICGLPYVLLARQQEPSVELLAAPVLQGERFGGRPIYFSDVIVRADSRFQSFKDLRGHSWAYNEPQSQSGYGITRYYLLKLGETGGFFSEVVEAGFHQEAIKMVRDGKVDASAIDAQVLAVAMRDDPQLTHQLRIIDDLGPSTIQPVVAARGLPDALKADIQAALLSMHNDPAARDWLAQGFFKRFATVTDVDYDDIRRMLLACEAAGFLEIR